MRQFTLGDAAPVSLYNWPVLKALIDANGNPKLQVGTVTPSSSFTRPADTTAYTSGDVVANSTTAGSVTPLAFTVGRTEGRQIHSAAADADRGTFATTQIAGSSAGRIARVCVSKSGTSTTNASFRLHLFTASPTPGAGDNAAIAVTVGTAYYLGSVDVTVGQAWTDGAAGFATCDIRWSLPTAGQKLYGLLEARGAYTPANAEVFTVTLEIDPN